MPEVSFLFPTRTQSHFIWISFLLLYKLFLHLFEQLVVNHKSYNTDSDVVFLTFNAACPQFPLMVFRRIRRNYVSEFISGVLMVCLFRQMLGFYMCVSASVFS